MKLNRNSREKYIAFRNKTNPCSRSTQNNNNNNLLLSIALLISLESNWVTKFFKNIIKIFSKYVLQLPFYFINYLFILTIYLWTVSSKVLQYYIFKNIPKKCNPHSAPLLETWWNFPTKCREKDAINYVILYLGLFKKFEKSVNWLVSKWKIRVSESVGGFQVCELPVIFEPIHI